MKQLQNKFRKQLFTKPIAKNQLKKEMHISVTTRENLRLLPIFGKITAYLRNQFKQKSHIKKKKTAVEKGEFYRFSKKQSYIYASRHQ